MTSFLVFSTNAESVSMDFFIIFRTSSFSSNEVRRSLLFLAYWVSMFNKKGKQEGSVLYYQTIFIKWRHCAFSLCNRTHTKLTSPPNIISFKTISPPNINNVITTFENSEIIRSTPWAQSALLSAKRILRIA